jgi:hypothetical protein
MIKFLSPVVYLIQFLHSVIILDFYLAFRIEVKCEYVKDHKKHLIHLIDFCSNTDECRVLYK